MSPSRGLRAPNWRKTASSEPNRRSRNEAISLPTRARHAVKHAANQSKIALFWPKNRIRKPAFPHKRNVSLFQCACTLRAGSELWFEKSGFSPKSCRASAAALIPRGHSTDGSWADFARGTSGVSGANRFFPNAVRRWPICRRSEYDNAGAEILDRDGGGRGHAGPHGRDGRHGPALALADGLPAGGHADHGKHHLVP